MKNEKKYDFINKLSPNNTEELEETQIGRAHV